LLHLKLARHLTAFETNFRFFLMKKPKRMLMVRNAAMAVITPMAISDPVSGIGGAIQSSSQ